MRNTLSPNKILKVQQAGHITAADVNTPNILWETISVLDFWEPIKHFYKMALPQF